jgi:hypothetical protein
MLAAEVPLDQVANRTVPELGAAGDAGRESRPHHPFFARPLETQHPHRWVDGGHVQRRTANRNSPRHKLLADHLEDRAQIVVVAAFLEYPIDEVDHPGTFRSCEILMLSREVEQVPASCGEDRGDGASGDE